MTNNFGKAMLYLAVNSIIIVLVNLIVDISSYEEDDDDDYVGVSDNEIS